MQPVAQPHAMQAAVHGRLQPRPNHVPEQSRAAVPQISAEKFGDPGGLGLELVLGLGLGLGLGPDLQLLLSPVIEQNPEDVLRPSNSG